MRADTTFGVIRTRTGGLLSSVPAVEETKDRGNPALAVERARAAALQSAVAWRSALPEETITIERIERYGCGWRLTGRVGSA